MTAPVGDDLTWLDDLQRAHAEATPGEWEVLPEEGVWEHAPSGNFGTFITSLDDLRPEHAALIVAAVNAVPTLIAELRKRDAALRAVLAECDEVDRRRDHLRTTFGIEPLAGRVHVETIRATLAAALTPESVPT